jgi:hypothetical protein
MSKEARAEVSKSDGGTVEGADASMVGVGGEVAGGPEVVAGAGAGASTLEAAVGEVIVGGREAGATKEAA